MDWLLRFQLGLTCRREDYDEISRIIPELRSKDFLEKHPEDNRIRFLHPFWRISYNELKNWTDTCVREKEEVHNSRHNVERICPLEFCPTKENRSKIIGGSITENYGKNNSEETIFQLMAMGGQIGARDESKKRDKNGDFSSISDFIKLIKKVHEASKGKNITGLYLTDPYLHMGIAVGGPNLIQYLKSVGLQTDSTAAIYISPRIKAGSQGFKSLKKCINDEFRNVRISHHEDKKRFHDRFYLVSYNDGPTKGVFGPSINAFQGDDVFLMGELEAHCVQALDKCMQ